MKPLRRSPSALAPVTEEPSPVGLQELAARPLEPAEQAAPTPCSNRSITWAPPARWGAPLTQVVPHHGRWVALLVWGPAALKLTDRDQWIGWSP